MKKMCFSLSIMGLLLLSLGACVKGPTAEEAGAMFMDRLIYDEKNQDFTKTFEQGEGLERLIEEDNNRFTKDFIEGFNSTSNGTFSDEKIKKLGEVWKTQVKKETKYKITNVKEEKDQAIVYYEVTGLNFTEAYQVMLNTVMEKIIKDPALGVGEDKANQLIIDETIKAISEIKSSNEPVRAQLNLIKTGSKYTISDDEAEHIENLFVATYLGQPDTKSLDNEIEKIGKEIETKMTNDTTSQ